MMKKLILSVVMIIGLVGPAYAFHGPLHGGGGVFDPPPRCVVVNGVRYCN